MKKIKSKAFTIVELVIVIAIIAILAAVLIPTFSSLIATAKMSADTQLAKNMNTALAIAEATDGQNQTFSDAIADILGAGYTIDKLTPTAEGCHLVWNQETDRIMFFGADNKCLYAEDETLNTPNYHLWKVSHSADDMTGGYSFYLADDFTGDLPTITAGLDVGTRTIAAINYTRAATDPVQDVIIRTNGGTLTVNAPKDTVKHYGSAIVVDVQQIAMTSYHEVGTVSELKVTAASGNFVFESSAYVSQLTIAPAAAQTGDQKIEINKASGTMVSSVIIDESTKENIQNIEVGNTTYTSENIDDVAAAVEPTEEEKAAFKYEITSAAELAAFRDMVNNGTTFEGLTIKLVADVDLSSQGNWTPIGLYKNSNGEYAYKPFSGIFDGGNHEIKNLTINNDDNKQKYSALFGYCLNATIKNFTVSGNVSGVDCAGVLAKLSGNTHVLNITSSVNVNSYEGVNSDNLARGKAGGIVLLADSGDYLIENCINNGSISTFNSASQPAGGIIGYANGDTNISSPTILNCTNNGKISTSNAANQAVWSGGIIGYLAGTIISVENCTNNGAIVSTNIAGGLLGCVGGNQTGLFVGCSNTGKITAPQAGGLLGSIGTGLIKNCSNTGDVFGTKYAAGFVASVQGYSAGKSSADYTSFTIENCNGSNATITGNECARFVSSAYGSVILKNLTKDSNDTVLDISTYNQCSIELYDYDLYGVTFTKLDVVTNTHGDDQYSVTNLNHPNSGHAASIKLSDGTTYYWWGAVKLNPSDISSVGFYYWTTNSVSPDKR